MCHDARMLSSSSSSSSSSGSGVYTLAAHDKATCALSFCHAAPQVHAMLVQHVCMYIDEPCLVSWLQLSTHISYICRHTASYNCKHHLEVSTVLCGHISGLQRGAGSVRGESAERGWTKTVFPASI